MPHKRNPVAAIVTLANTAQAPGLVSTVLVAAAGHEHERAAGAWHAEWRPLLELFLSVGSAAAWLADCLTHLEVDPARMRDNLDLPGGAGQAMEQQRAAAPPLAGVDLDTIDRAGYVGATGEFVTAALQRHSERSTA
jgi:3-carboxy-cis,cis-muconate cycloisomerase